MRYLVLVTGSRTWTDARAVYKALTEIGEHIGYEYMAVMHGDNPQGADCFADLWCILNNVPALRRPADWARYGNRAGNVRNTEMVAEVVRGTGDPECAEALAFQDTCRAPRCFRPRPHYSHGTADCLAKITSAGIPVQVFH